MTDKSVYGGLFKDPSYLSSDADPTKTDPYVKQDTIPSRYLGKNMVLGHAAPGQHPDAYFDKKYLTLASTEQNGGKPVGYADASAAKNKVADTNKAISDQKFKYPSFPQKSTGPGSYFGCFQSKPHEYMTEPWDDGKKRRKKQKSRAAPAEAKAGKSLPNIKTNPAKKGTYGYPGLLLAQEAYNDDWRVDRAAQDKEDQRRAKQKGPELKALGPPFKVLGVSHAYLDELPATGVPGVYTDYTPPDDKSKRKRGAAEGGEAAAKPLHEKAFRGSTVKTGNEGCINPFPNSWIDPAELEASKKGKSKRRKEKDAAADPASLRPKGASEWKPNSFEKTSIVSSCLRRFY